MLPFGHVAVAGLTNRMIWGEVSPLPTLVGALLPDLLDKPPAWVLKITSTSHGYGHTPLVALLAGLVASRVMVRNDARQLATAYYSHLVADDAHHGRVPWLLPFSAWKRRSRSTTNARWKFGILLEFPAVALIGYWIARTCGRS